MAIDTTIFIFKFHNLLTCAIENEKRKVVGRTNQQVVKLSMQFVVFRVTLTLFCNLIVKC